MPRDDMGMTTASRITWTDDEWLTFGIALMRAMPEYKGRLPSTLPIPALKIANQSLPEERRRLIRSNFNAKYHAKLEAVYEAIAAGPVEQPAPAVEEPPAPAVAPVAAPEPVAEAPARAARRPKVFWRDADYLDLARELHRLNPHDTYLKTETLAGLTLAEVMEAQRALSPDRRRALHQVSNIREPLLAAFKVLRAEIEAKAPAPAVEPTPEPIPEPAPAPEPVAEAPAAAPVNPHELALRVLCEMLAPTLASQLIPELVKQLTPILAGKQVAGEVAAIVPSRASATADPVDPLEYGPPPGWNPPAYTVPSTPAAPRLPIVAVLGLPPVQLQELRAAFPAIEFITSQGKHSARTLESLQSAKRVITANTDANSMNQMTDKMLAKHFGERYVRANGGMSAVKRQIQMWLHAGVIH